MFEDLRVRINSFFKFGLLSLFGLMLDVALFTILIFDGFDPVVSNTTSALLAASFVYIFNYRFVLKRRLHSSTLVGVIVYIIYTVFIVTLFSAVIGFLGGFICRVMMIDLNFSAIMAKIIVTPFNLLLNFYFARMISEKL